MKGESEQVPRVLVAQNTLAHYRQELALTLQSSESLSFTFLHDPEGPMTRGPDAIRPIERTAIDAEIVAQITRFGPFLWQPGLVHAYRHGRFDAVVLQGDPLNLANWMVLVGAYCERGTTPILLWTQGWSRPDRPTRALVKRVFFGMANGVLLYSRRAVQIGVREGHSSDRLIFIGNSIPGPPASLVSASTGGDADRRNPGGLGGNQQARLRLVTVVRLTRDRDLDELLEALEVLKSRGVTAHLDLVGDGQDRGRLMKAAAASGVDVEFHGAVFDPTYLADLYASADVSVIPGRAGLAVAQALHHGVPVIAHDDFRAQMPEASAIGEGVSGEFYTRHDRVDLADKIELVAGGRRAGRYPADGCLNAAHGNFSTEEHSGRMVAAVIAAMQRPSPSQIDQQPRCWGRRAGILGRRKARSRRQVTDLEAAIPGNGAVTRGSR